MTRFVPMTRFSNGEMIDEDERVDMMEYYPYNWRFLRDL